MDVRYYPVVGAFSIAGRSYSLEQLKANGFVVEDSVDEARDYISYTRNVQNDTSAAHLIINPTINCNFSCWYCYEQHTKSKMDEETINRVKRLIYRIMTEKRPLQFSFFGGEPLLYYKQVMKVRAGLFDKSSTSTLLLAINIVLSFNALYIANKSSALLKSNSDNQPKY